MSIAKRRPFIPAGLAFGGALHSAIAWLNQKRMKANPVSLDCLYRVFEADWYAQKAETGMNSVLRKIKS